MYTPYLYVCDYILCTYTISMTSAYTYNARALLESRAGAYTDNYNNNVHGVLLLRIGKM